MLRQRSSENPTLVLAVVGFAAPGFDSPHTWPFPKGQRNSKRSKHSFLQPCPLPPQCLSEVTKVRKTNIRRQPRVPLCFRGPREPSPRERTLCFDWKRKGKKGAAGKSKSCRISRQLLMAFITKSVRPHTWRADTHKSNAIQQCSSDAAARQFTETSSCFS